MVAPKSNRFQKSRRRQAAGLAENLRYLLRIRSAGRRQRGEVRDAQIFSTTSAESSWLRRELGTTEVANWDAGQT